MSKIPKTGIRKQLTDIYSAAKLLIFSNSYIKLMSDFYSKLLLMEPDCQTIYKIFQVPEKQFDKR